MICTWPVYMSNAHSHKCGLLESGRRTGRADTFISLSLPFLSSTHVLPGRVCHGAKVKVFFSFFFSFLHFQCLAKDSLSSVVAVKVARVVHPLLLACARFEIASLFFVIGNQQQRASCVLCVSCDKNKCWDRFHGISLTQKMVKPSRLSSPSEPSLMYSSWTDHPSHPAAPVGGGEDEGEGSSKPQLSMLSLWNSSNPLSSGGTAVDDPLAAAGEQPAALSPSAIGSIKGKAKKRKVYIQLQVNGEKKREKKKYPRPIRAAHACKRESFVFSSSFLILLFPFLPSLHFTRRQRLPSICNRHTERKKATPPHIFFLFPSFKRAFNWKKRYDGEQWPCRLSTAKKKREPPSLFFIHINISQGHQTWLLYYTVTHF